MNFQKDFFDSNHFQTDVFKLTLDTIANKDEVSDILAAHSRGIIFCFVPLVSKHITLLEELDFSLISIRNTYEYKSAINVEFNRTTEVIIKPYQQEAIDENQIKTLALTIGSQTRYGKDPKIDSKIVELTYVDWIKNSLFNNLADKVFFAWHHDTVIGICTVKLKLDKGEIDLFGVLPEYRSSGVSSELLSNALTYLQEHGAVDITVVTAGENIAANRFFQKHDFRIKTVELAYHKHY